MGIITPLVCFIAGLIVGWLAFTRPAPASVASLSRTCRDEAVQFFREQSGAKRSTVQTLGAAMSGEQKAMILRWAVYLDAAADWFEKGTGSDTLVKEREELYRLAQLAQDDRRRLQGASDRAEEADKRLRGAAAEIEVLKERLRGEDPSDPALVYLSNQPPGAVREAPRVATRYSDDEDIEPLGLDLDGDPTDVGR